MVLSFCRSPGSINALKTPTGADNLLQVRTKVLNDQLLETFVRWYPGMQTEQETQIEKKAA